MEAHGQRGGGCAGTPQEGDGEDSQPEEGELRDVGWKLGLAKRKLMALGRDLMMSQAHLWQPRPMTLPGRLGTP
jgi:hypothetical protein